METKKYRSRIKAWAIFFWCIDTSIADTLTIEGAVWILGNATLHTQNPWKSTENTLFVNVWMLFRAKNTYILGVWILGFSTLHSRFCKQVWFFLILVDRFFVISCYWFTVFWDSCEGLMKSWWEPVTPFTLPLVIVTDSFTAAVAYWIVREIRITSPGLVSSNRRVGKTSPGLVFPTRRVAQHPYFPCLLSCINVPCYCTDIHRTALYGKGSTASRILPRWRPLHRRNILFVRSLLPDIPYIISYCRCRTGFRPWSHASWLHCLSTWNSRSYSWHFGIYLVK